MADFKVNSISDNTVGTYTFIDYNSGAPIAKADKLQADTIVNEAGTGAPELSEGAVIPSTKSLDSDIIKNASGSYTMLDYNSGAPIAKVDKMQADTITNEAGTGTPSATYGISFPAGQGLDFSASEGSGATSSILDDYEEGTWTPVLSDNLTGGNTTTSFTVNYSSYQKVGNRVHICLQLVDIDTTGLTSSNGLYIQGLPYQVGDIGVGSIVMDNVTFTSNYVCAQSVPGTTSILLRATTSGDLDGTILVSRFSSGVADFQLNVSYSV